MAPSRAAAVECAICYEAFYFPFTTTCGHAFCHKCLASWTARSCRQAISCPLCRSLIPRVDGEPSSASLNVARYVMVETAFNAIGTWIHVALLLAAGLAFMLQEHALPTATIPVVVGAIFLHRSCKELLIDVPVLVCCAGLTLHVVWHQVQLPLVSSLQFLHNAVYSRHRGTSLAHSS